jgi:hypothetical protein
LFTYFLLQNEPNFGPNQSGSIPPAMPIAPRRVPRPVAEADRVLG